MRKKNLFNLLFITILLLNGCTKSPISSENNNSSWVFVANEGNFCSTEFGMDCSNNIYGSISMIDAFGNIINVTDIGNLVNSLLVHNDFLFVIVNQDHIIHKYKINVNGIEHQNTISTNNSSPREMIVINDKLFFTNWNSKDVKIMNINSNILEDNSIEINGLPEDIIFDGEFIWVSIPEISAGDGNKGTNLAKINPNTYDVEYIEVGRGPTSLTYFAGSIYVSRTYYEFDGIDEDGWWINPKTLHGTTKVNNEILKTPYEHGSACGGIVLNYNNAVYRSYDGGIAPILEDLQIDHLNRLGSYSQNEVYNVDIINNNIWFCLTNYSDMNIIKVVNSNGVEINTFDVGINPGDLDYWEKSK